MTRKFSIFRPMNLKRPPSPTKPQMIAVLQQRDKEPPEPSVFLAMNSDTNMLTMNADTDRLVILEQEIA